ncbi:hypothetical protein SAMN04488511_101165 [Pedobacter suwonensis]|uniref:Uncharacterized protein n=1 Tax=Pedobacter suwonensis TaxID=332999 RepID=A0A1I0SFJ9_9SPHI|nr:hypothetical protein [Pedobacter suwonensis]SFA38285.1 hypothetical protein SAMN04488511_101165 [Pedobacter suwonensis]
MVLTEVEVKKQKVVEDPKLSLKQFARYPDSTVRGKITILTKGKYPGSFIPTYYEEARKIIVNAFSANFNDGFELYFTEFQRQAARLKKEALPFEPKTKDYKNRNCSGEGLERMVAMQKSIMPILQKYIFSSNLGHNRDNIYIKEVRIGAMSDLHLFDSTRNQIGLLKFNFTKTKLKDHEAPLSLLVLRSFFANVKQLKLEPKHCLFIDVFSGNIYNAERASAVTELAETSCREIAAQWPHIIKPNND